MEKRNEFLNANEDVVSKVLENQPDDEYLYDLADLFKTFGDSTRIKIPFIRIGHHDFKSPCQIFDRHLLPSRWHPVFDDKGCNAVLI